MSLLNKSKQIVLKELNDRHDSRRDLLAFTTYTKRDFITGTHHRRLCEKLQAVERGEIKRLMVFMPPRHGKSELVSTRFPAWFLGRHPDRQVIMTSYSAKLAEKFGRDVRNIVQSNIYRNVFPGLKLANDSKAKDLWRTQQGGIFLSSGIGGSITGYGGHLLIIDDPIKDRQEAESEHCREQVWNWYKSVLRTRLMPEGAIILVLTRWHVDDLAGRLISEMENGSGETWEILNLPARATETDILDRSIGDPLWPEIFDHDALMQIEKSIGERDWLALYQGEPRILTGSLFKIHQVSIVDVQPKGYQPVRRWDFAASRQAGKYDPDWTVGVKMQRNEDDSYTVLDVVRFRGAPDEVEKTVQAVASQDGAEVRIIIPQDPGQAGVAQVQYYSRLLAGYRIQAVRETGNKVTRADPFACQVNMGNVSLIRAGWNRAYLDELAAFPGTAHDDQVDASAGAFEQVALTRRFPKMPAWEMISRL